MSIHLVSLDAREVRLSWEKYPADWLFGQKIRRVIGLLAVPDFSLNDFSMSWAATQPNTIHPEGSHRSAPETCQRLTYKYISQAATSSVGLSTLPAELIGMICDELCMDDLLRLALVARNFWNLAWPYMEKELMGFMAPWAGHRIICMGDVHTADNPPGMLSEGEEKELASGLTLDEVGGCYFTGCDGPRFEDHDTSLSGIVEYRYDYLDYLDEDFRSVPEYRGIRNIALNQMHEFPESMRSRVLEFSRHRPIEDYYPVGKKWVLRNLTTHEFIRSEVVAGNSEHSGPYIDGLGFEHIIMLRIFWASSPNPESDSELSSDPKLSKINNRDVTRGIWAGHRLEITTSDRHARSRSWGVTWIDISEEAIEDIIQLWRRPNNFVNDETCEL